jgi:iron complex transport system ATP-binding protein
LLQAADVSFGYGPPPRAARRGAGALAATARDRAPGTDVLRDVSVRIGDKGLVGILGPNGSGKTTLLKILGGLLAPARGSVSIDGRPIAALSRREIARRVAMVPQETRLAFDYSVLEVVLMGRYPHLAAFELEGLDDVAIARDALAATGTLPLVERVFDTLSGGEKQRVVIAAALAQEAGVMLLDEPTASLDPGYQVDVASLLRRLNEDRGVTMVVATHDLNLAAGLCRELVLLREGRVLAAGPTVQVLTREAIRALYGLEADVQYHERAGHLTVVPIGKAG